MSAQARHCQRVLLRAVGRFLGKHHHDLVGPAVVQRRDDDDGHAARVQHITRRDRVELARDLRVREELALELVGREDGRERDDVALVDLHEARGHVELAIVAEHRVTKVRHVRVLFLEQRHEAQHRAQERVRADVAREEVAIVADKAVGLEAVDEGVELRALEHLAGARLVARVAAKLHRVDGVDLEAEELERKHGALVAHVAVDDVRLHGEHARVRQLRRGDHGTHRGARAPARGETRRRVEPGARASTVYGALPQAAHRATCVPFVDRLSRAVFFRGA
mmetsp:Transcript_32271/g.108708  ORF Transcript_32271/g.108708 Transcript_32271/m.108708 type:complete len:280 (-) Transcript_32271:11-850(-)